MTRVWVLLFPCLMALVIVICKQKLMMSHLLMNAAKLIMNGLVTNMSTKITQVFTHSFLLHHHEDPSIVMERTSFDVHNVRHSILGFWNQLTAKWEQLSEPKRGVQSPEATKIASDILHTRKHQILEENVPHWDFFWQFAQTKQILSPPPLFHFCSS